VFGGSEHFLNESFPCYCPIASLPSGDFLNDFESIPNAIK